MTQIIQRPQTPEINRNNYWQRIPILARSIILGLVVTIIGTLGIPLLASLLPEGVQVFAFLALLWVYWKYFTGSWAPKSTQAARRSYTRSLTMSRPVMLRSLLAALLLVIVWQAGLVVTFRLVPFPADTLMSEYGLDSMPIWMAWSYVLVAALSAGITEEVGFRGYAQVPLEKRYGPAAAIGIVSIVFLALHLNQGWLAPMAPHVFVASILFGLLAYASGSLVPGILAHFVLDIFNFSFWWSNVAGKYLYRPISETGLDAHFLVSMAILMLAVLGFFYLLGKIRQARLATSQASLDQAA